MALHPKRRLMILNIRLFALTLTMAFVLLPLIASTQGFGTREDNTSLNGERLTYHPRANISECQADCVNNPNCKGYTWIQAGTYNAGDQAMCYLMSTVTGRVAARGHYSAEKGAAGGGGDGGGLTAEDNTNRPGADYKNFDLPQPNWSLCRDACANDGNCRAYTYVKPGAQGAAARCWLKSSAPAAVQNGCCISGVRSGGGSTGGGGGGTISAVALKGSWQWRQCNDQYGLLMGIEPKDDATFEGAFENGNGLIKNGRVRGNQITFDRVLGPNSVQSHSGQLVNEGGRLKIINGVWTGAYQENCSGRNNWHAEKQ